jgi:signal transduction histidine kinase/CheY-like chemotaxis protein
MFMIKKSFANPAMWMFAFLGSCVFVFSLTRLPFKTLDFQFVLLVAIALGLSTRVIVKIPRFSSQISVSDAIVFLTLMLYGGEAAILLSAVECLCASFHFSRTRRIIFFNFGMMAFSTFITVWVLRLTVGDMKELAGREYSTSFIFAVCLMAMTQYITNTGLVAFVASCRTEQPIWVTWRKTYLWTSITYFAGASAAAMISKMFGSIGVYSLIITAPIIVIVYLTYQTYLKNFEAAAQQAEQAERHVAELNHYITEQERIREQFTQMEKLSALGELASGVAHDFNNTLAGILGRAELMLRSDDPEKLKRGLGIIIKTAEDGAKTVKRIQDFARQRRDHDFAPVSVDQILLDVSEITRPRWKDRSEAANVHISLDMRIRSNAVVMGDDSELREVLVNMVFNAVDAMPQGGCLTLSAEEVGDDVVISVGDTGTGMSAEVRSRIFDPFFTTKGKAGLGLGLAVSFGIIRRHEGTVEVESEIGSGTSFRIKLPIARGVLKPIEIDAVEAAKQFAAQVSLKRPASRRNRTHILVVDDEEHVRELLRDILDADNCEVTLAESGREALALFDAGKFDAVFTDIGMPGMSGWELANAIRERNRELPIAVITGWGEAVGSDEQQAAQVDWVVTKPFTTNRISELAHEITQRRNARNKNILTFAA